MERAPLVPIALALAVGTALSLPLNAEQRTIVAIVFTALCITACSGRGFSALRAGTVVALAAGLLFGYVHSTNTPDIREMRTQRYTATLLSCSDTTAGSGFDCGLDLDGGPTVLAYLDRTAPPGTRVIVRGRVTPFDAPRNPGEPDQRLIEAERGYGAALAAASILQELGPAGPSLPVLIARAHAFAAGRLRRFLGEPYASIVAGELWGERATLPPDLRSEFQDSGTVHVLVTAGLHLGVIAWLTMGLLAWLRVPRLPACAIAALIVWSYVVFSGTHLPAVRAGTMISFGLCARAVGAKALSWNALAAAVIVVLLMMPQSLLSASFAMSFSCVGAILLFAPHVTALLERVGEMPHALREALALTIATQVGVWPVTAATFLLFAPYAVAANAAVVPAVGVTMLLGAAQIATADAPILSHAFANLNAWLLEWTVAVVRVTSGLPCAHIVMTPAPLWALCMYDVALLASVWLLQRGARTAACAVIIFATGTVLWPPRPVNRDLQITVLDVGQADAIVIRTPGGRVLLVDAGGRLERGAQNSADSTAERVGETIVVPYLIRSGIHHVDTMLLSHPHGDHAGGLAPVLRGLGAYEVADSGQQYAGFAYRDAIAVAHMNGTPIVYPRAGTVWKTNDGVSLTFLGPQVPFITGSRNDINNNSLVFMLQYKSFRMLFTGDAGAEAEQRVLAENVNLRADVLKVGHHGSAYSSTPEFIAAVHPKYAIISVGRHNLFGHPAPQTIDTLQRFGARVYRTDQNGALSILSDGISYEVGSLLAPTPKPDHARIETAATLE